MCLWQQAICWRRGRRWWRRKRKEVVEEEEEEAFMGASIELLCMLGTDPSLSRARSLSWRHAGWPAMPPGSLTHIRLHERERARDAGWMPARRVITGVFKAQNCVSTGYE
jgi:hypothetical protein